jgi:hypothetical protein
MQVLNYGRKPWGVSMRGLSIKFMKDLLEPEGKLHPLLERVKIDHSLMLAIRDGYLNIYYRGGNIVRIMDYDDLYQTYFDVNYGFGKIVADSELMFAIRLTRKSWLLF